MLSVTVKTPRFGRAIDAMLHEVESIGAAARRVAIQNAYGEVDATFAHKGRRLDPDARVQSQITRGDLLDLVLLGC